VGTLETDAEKGMIAPAVLLDSCKGIIGPRGFGLTMIVGEPCVVLLVGVEIVEDDFEPSLWIRRDSLIP
jgi:hypothetical protein